MRKKDLPLAKRRLILMVLPILVIGLLLMANRLMEYMAEYTQTGRCYRDGLILSTEELRVRTIRSLLIAEMQTAERQNTDRPSTKAFLISRSLTSDDVVSAVVSKSIVKLPEEEVYPINNESDIENVHLEFLRSEFSIIRYGGGNVFITPSRDLEVVNSKVARKHLDEERKNGLNLSLFERALGYGQLYFQVKNFSFIDLGCCEERYSTDPKGGISPERYAHEVIRAIKTGNQPARRHLIVSNCGDILHHYDDGYTWYLF